MIPAEMEWRTKPGNRFVLRWIKRELSARITPSLARAPWIRPWMITLLSCGLGVAGGVVFALGLGWHAGLVAFLSQILDGVDGQYARLTGQQSRWGAFWDSVLDRYADGAMVIGLVVYLQQDGSFLAEWQLLILGSLALIGSNLHSYTDARAGDLRLEVAKGSLAGKGTRMTVMVLGGLGTLAWSQMPVFALFYLTVHPNAVVIKRLSATRKADRA